ncbi:DUF885 domain-containing protein [Gilvimarinus sp. 2_MG-2023]|uniref:DUF885 domain-containing protein n=1 Tax=Gilvimarinus sp. 2_MG-2023 TaxID=3062666 RepID=UPI0026E240B8|nr:DUF885 domain-containing protein [Gilvimarinus sp. 2_MG-2023]MDO6569662.1 DUF885 domain-containing protein [Gilvimarinus sp. 2_MG-2023]
MKIWNSLRLTLLAMLTLASIATAAAPPEATHSDHQAERLFEQVFEQWVALSPMWQTQLGRDTNKGQWDDISPAANTRAHRLYQQQLEQLQALDADSLSPANQLNRRLLINQLQTNIRHYRWRNHSYPVNQMFGWHSHIPAFLINSHTIQNEADIAAFIARLHGVAPLIEQLIKHLQHQAEQGILAPSFVYPLVIQDSRNIISGAPFTATAISATDGASKPSPLWQHFTQQLDGLALPQAREKRYLNAARDALLNSVEPAYQNLIQTLTTQEQASDTRAGVWKLPQGDDYYRAKLKAITTTEFSAEHIHQMGLDAVARIHQEMKQLQKTIGYKGDLSAFFNHLKQDPTLYYANTPQGRQDYLADTRSIIADIRQLLPDLFGRLPQAELVVKAVEPFREKSAGKAFYQSPAQDGSRPGIYYVNLHDLSAMPRYQMQALAYHEALPGHHMQIAIAQELTNTPAFRRHSHYTAYIEGWGLYAEKVPQELGLYQDPYADFGRLSFELWRAIRLVVDTGLHHYRWSKEQAIDYFASNSPMTRPDATREVERYIVMPGQATAYMIGLLEIERLKSESQQRLGDDFELSDFHDVILGSGALPLNILKEQVDAWIRSKSAQ